MTVQFQKCCFSFNPNLDMPLLQSTHHASELGPRPCHRASLLRRGESGPDLESLTGPRVYRKLQSQHAEWSLFEQGYGSFFLWVQFQVATPVINRPTSERLTHFNKEIANSMCFGRGCDNVFFRKNEVHCQLNFQIIRRFQIGFSVCVGTT